MGYKVKDLMDKNFLLYNLQKIKTIENDLPGGILNDGSGYK